MKQKTKGETLMAIYRVHYNLIGIAMRAISRT